MMKKLTKRERIIEILRKNNFNCFPIRKYDDSESVPKRADHRYDASRTIENQPIDEKENYGYIASKNNCTIDFDHTTYNEVLDKIASKYMVIKTAHNKRHLPVINLKGNATKIELFDTSIQDKKIIEIQGTEQYVVGSGSTIRENGLDLTYENIGTEVIFDADGQDFDSFVDYICKKYGVEGNKSNRNQHYEMRERFKNNDPPTEGTSNDYFFDASLQCNTDGLTKGEAIEKILAVYYKWNPSKPKRAWSNIETKINDVYDNDRKITLGRKGGSDSGIDRTEIAQEIINTRKLYSDSEDKLAIIYENKKGFLEPINGKLRKELQKVYPKMEKSDHNEIESKLFGLAEDMPERNKDLIVFRNGIYSISKHGFVKSNDIAFTGFRDYDYIEKPNPKQFKKIIFDNVPKKEHEQRKAGLASILKPYLDPKMTVVHGKSRVGKSTGQSIIAKLLGQYSMVTDIDKLLKDKPTQANLKGKLYVVIREITTDWEKVNQLKIMLGEQTFSGRKNFGDHDEWDNTIKVDSSANNLLRIPRKEEDAMFQGRLSLVHNTKEKAYAEDETLESRVIKEEGSEIISYLVNLMQDEYEYADRITTEKEWKKIANPEDEIIEKYFTESRDSEESLYSLAKWFYEEYEIKLNRKEITEAFESFNFNVFAGMVKNCIKIVPKIDHKSESQKSL